jgi:hypothetical protein|tara:strand:+ start:342 stop:1160 length:819 start_codon:yes stop_codon:yes gene_type:complete
MKVITMAAWRRPDYFLKVIESIENAEGIEDYHLLVSIDGGYPDKQEEMRDILGESNLDYTKIEIFAHEENLGCAGNTGFILAKGFEKADRVIHLEDDTVLHPDCLRFLEYNLEKYEDNEHIFSISAFTIPKWNDICLDGDWLEPNLVGIRDRFTCHAWATWKRVWDEIKDSWFGIEFLESMPYPILQGEDFLNHVKLTDKGSWANPMMHYWRRGRLEICSHTSFSQNIGRYDGWNTTDGVFFTEMDTPMFKPEQRVYDFDTDFVDDYLEELE